MRDGSATPVRPGADIGSGTVDAADAQDSAGLLLFARPNELFLVRRYTWLVDRLARLEPTGGLRPAGSGRAHGLGSLGGCRAPATSAAARRRRRPVLRLAIGSCEGKSRLFEDRRTGGLRHLDLERCI